MSIYQRKLANKSNLPQNKSLKPWHQSGKTTSMDLLAGACGVDEQRLESSILAGHGIHYQFSQHVNKCFYKFIETCQLSTEYELNPQKLYDIYHSLLRFSVFRGT